MFDDMTSDWAAEQIERLRATPQAIADRLTDGTLTIEPVEAGSVDSCQIDGHDEPADVVVSFTSPQGARGFLRACHLHTMQALYKTHRAH